MRILSLLCYFLIGSPCWLVDLRMEISYFMIKISNLNLLFKILIKHKCSVLLLPIILNTLLLVIQILLFLFIVLLILLSFKLSLIFIAMILLMMAIIVILLPLLKLISLFSIHPKNSEDVFDN